MNEQYNSQNLNDMNNNQNQLNSPQNKKTQNFLKIAVVVVVCLVVITIAVLGFYLYSNSKVNNRIQGYLKLSEKYIDNLEYDDAIAVLKEAIEIDPKNERVYLLLADAYCGKADLLLDQGDYIAANECYIDAINDLEDSKDYVQSDEIESRINEIEGLRGELEEQYGDEIRNIDRSILVQAENEENYELYEVLGEASLSSGDIVILTQSNFYCGGAVWCDKKYDTSKPFTLELDICSDQGNVGGLSDGPTIDGKTTGADGFVINFSPEISVGNTGGDMGFSGYTGVEFDTYPFNGGDTPDQHVALIEGASSNHLVYSTQCGFINDENWHHIRVEYDNGRLEVFYDGANMISTNYTLEKEVYFGITAATGSACNRHMIKNFKCL